MERNFYVTSPIYYVNDVPHIGHAYTSIACDVMARFKRLEGYNTFFLTGTDEHGQKVEKSAIAKGKNPQEFCDEVSIKFRELTKVLNLSNDDFIRTTEERHKKAAQAFWQKLEEKGWIYKDVYEGWYALRDEAFYSADEIVDGKAPTGAEVTWHKEESYFFKLSAFQDKLLALYEAAPDFIRPQSRFNEVVSFVKGGLKDLSISRTSFSWGIAVPEKRGQTPFSSTRAPEHPSTTHVMYVWLDALTNYISALEFPDEKAKKYQDFWVNASESPLHIVGKDIVRFHAVYWPAFLMAAEINVPYGIYAHGWWTNEGQKISKSIGNVIDPLSEIKWLEEFEINNETAVDYFKYFLLREVPFGNDGDYSRDNLILRINSELANNIGNLAQRSLSMIWKNNEGKIVDLTGYSSGQELLKNAYNLKEILSKKMSELDFDLAIFEILSHASKCNEFINNKAPWNLKKEGKIEEMNLVLSIIAENLRVIAIALQPFLPNLSVRILEVLNVDETLRGIDFIASKHCIKPNHKILEPKAIFPRLEKK